MESNKILEADVLDIIFEQKNKQYGAYELRKNYAKRARKALIIAAIFAIVVSGVPLIAGLLIHDDGDIRKPSERITEIRSLPTEPPAVPPLQPNTDAAVPENIQDNIPTEIVVAVDAPDEVITPVDKNPTSENTGPGNPGEGPAGPALDPGPGTVKIPDPVIEIKDPVEKIFDSEVLTQDPEFPGGDDAMVNFLKSHLKYPQRAAEAGKDGKVTLAFVIDKDGKISEIDFLRKAGYGFDEEAKRVMGLMPEWKPGKINGVPVKVRYQIPIIFELED